MLEAMRDLALDFLHGKLGGPASESSEAFYRRVRAESPERLFPYLVEKGEKEAKSSPTSKSKQKPQPHYYTISPHADDTSIAVLEIRDFIAGDGLKLPFNQPSGPRSPALGPVIKRLAKSGGKLESPKLATQKSTLNQFLTISNTGAVWSNYFREVYSCWTRPKLLYGGEVLAAEGQTAFSLAMDRIDETVTVFVAYEDAQRRMPGMVPEYINYLEDILVRAKYLPDSKVTAGAICSLCDAGQVDVYPNALRGAGINIANVNRDGAFAGLDKANAWKGYALCVGCADLLYVYYRHVAWLFRTRVAGEDALALPTLSVADARRVKYVKRLKEWLDDAQKKVGATEDGLIDALAEEELAVASVTLLWAEFGQRIDDVRGVVADVLPSRLRALSEANRRFDKYASPVFPDNKLDEFAIDLSLGCLRPLLQCPVKGKAKARNASRRLFDLRRDIADAIYHGTDLPCERLQAKLHETAQWHWEAACGSDHPTYGLLREGYSAKTGQNFLTAAGWVRHAARFLHYCRTIGGGMVTVPYEPTSDLLRPYFGPESGIDSPAKAFAFILGVLYGKLTVMQRKRDVNVGANALTWLKRLTISGKDLPELFVKVREKMMVYGSEKGRGEDSRVRELNAELGTIVATCREYHILDEIDTCFFLLLGQALALKVLPPKGPRPQGDADAGRA
jgi:CRISPR-associated protein Csh1